MATWRSLARELQLTFLVPAAARAEAILARPDDGDLIDVLLADPTTVLVSHPEPEVRGQAQRLHLETGVFDPLATWVTDLCRRRAWPALTSDPQRLRRLAPDLAVDSL